MRIVTPVSTFDQHIAPKWCEVIKHLDCGRNHELHLVYPRSAEMTATVIQEQLRDHFDVVKMHLMQSEPIGGWPFGPNTQFHACATAMSKDNPRLPWFLCELDCYPLKTNSFDLLAARYSSAGTPFFGKIANTFWRDDSGRISSSLFGKDDTTMSGCAVYPGDLISRRFTAPLMADLMKGFDETTGAPTAGWDVHLRFAIKREGVADAANLIADNWNTINYKVEGGRLVCENNPDHEIYRRNPNFEIRKTNNPVSLDALFVHGCKDNSLPDLIIEGKLPQEAIYSRPTQASKPKDEEPQVNAALENQLAEMKRMMEQQQQLIANLLQQQNQPKYSKEPKIIPPDPIKRRNTTLERAKVELKERLEEEGVVIDEPTQPEIAGTTTLEPEISTVAARTEVPHGEVISMIRSAGRSVSCKSLADKFGKQTLEMRDICSKIPGLKVGNGPIYWITLVE